MNWAPEYHNRGFVVRPVVVETDFELQSLPNPRDAYAVKIANRANAPGTWDSSAVEVFGVFGFEGRDGLHLARYSPRTCGPGICSY